LTQFEKVDIDVTCYKPKMKVAKNLKDVPINFANARNLTVQVKADGEFNYVKYQREAETFAINRFGRKTVDLPALNELVSCLATWNIVEAEFLAEMYAVDEAGKPLTLPNLIHYLKGSDTSLQKRIKLGVFDLISLNGARSELIYPLKFGQMFGWFHEAKLVHVLPWSEPTEFQHVQNFWNEKVEGEKWEGLVIRLNGDTWKVKPNCDIDAAIIGINKNNKGFEQGKAKSLKMALMNEDGSFVEIGDCSGIGEEEAEQLFELVKSFKIGEDNMTVYVQPIVIATVEYIQTYPDTRNKCYVIEKGEIFEKGEQILVRLRNPHVKGYRADKKACIEDIGLNQIS
jgi:ATP-dependent DNA ligase